MMTKHISNIHCSDLRIAISKSFDNTHYPGDENLIRGIYPPLLDDNVEIYNLYRGRLWHTLDDEFFFSHGALQFSIGFLTLKSFMYYLPVFMCHIISPQWNWNTGCLLDGMFEYLEPENNRHIDLVYSSLNEQQSTSVALFLQYLSENSDIYFDETCELAQKALANHWQRFLN